MKWKTLDKVLFAIVAAFLILTLYFAVSSSAQDQEEVVEERKTSTTAASAVESVENATRLEPAEPTVPDEPVLLDSNLSAGPSDETAIERIKRLISPVAPGDPEKDYRIRVFKDRQMVCVFDDPEGDGDFRHLIHAFVCSTAIEPHETPSGLHKIGVKYPSGYMLDASYGQYCSEFIPTFYLHAVPSYGGVEETGVGVEDFNQLGKVASHGCIRLLTKDALWIYNYCKTDTPVEVLDSSEDFPDLPQLDRLWMKQGEPSWDPTNPNPLNPYQQDPARLLPYNPLPEGK